MQNAKIQQNRGSSGLTLYYTLDTFWRIKLYNVIQHNFIVCSMYNVINNNNVFNVIHFNLHEFMIDWTCGT